MNPDYDPTPKPRKAKTPSILVAGNWRDGNFVTSPIQPLPAITDVNEMVAWAKKQAGSDAYVVEFVRKVPGTFRATPVAAVKTTFG